MLESPFNTFVCKSEGLQSDTPTQAFSCENSEIFEEHLF